jgi:hypothetical protein
MTLVRISATLVFPKAYGGSKISVRTGSDGLGAKALLHNGSAGRAGRWGGW